MVVPKSTAKPQRCRGDMAVAVFGAIAVGTAVAALYGRLPGLKPLDSGISSVIGPGRIARQASRTPAPVALIQVRGLDLIDGRYRSGIGRGDAHPAFAAATFCAAIRAQQHTAGDQCFENALAAFELRLSGHRPNCYHGACGNSLMKLRRVIYGWLVIGKLADWENR